MVAPVTLSFDVRQYGRHATVAGAEWIDVAGAMAQSTQRAAPVRIVAIALAAVLG